MRFRLAVDGEVHEIEVDRRSRDVLVKVDGAGYRATVRSRGDATEVRIRGAAHEVRTIGGQWLIDGEAHDVRGEIPEEAALGVVGAGSTGPHAFEVKPPMPGRLVRLPISPGMVVKRGQPLAVLEAMKMQNEIPAPADAVVKEVRAKEGESIPADRVIAILETRSG